jgi:hypothetical protein
MSNWQYRTFMINNAIPIMQKNLYEATKEQMAYPAVFDYHVGQPYLYNSCQETTTPVGYEHSDLKAEFLNKHAMYLRRR